MWDSRWNYEGHQSFQSSERRQKIRNIFKLKESVIQEELSNKKPSKKGGTSSSKGKHAHGAKEGQGCESKKHLV